MVSTKVNIPGYRIYDLLYNGSRTLVYRGYQETDSLPVVIKLLKNPYPSFSELLSFRNQYTIAKNLNSPLIIQTYSLEPYQNGYALVMEDFGGISLKDYFTSDQTRYIASLEEFLEIAIALCNTLDILYRERIIHKDIKPSNILINPESKQLKLIDFSIASLLPRETQTLINPNVLEGTLAYISPEQTGRMNRGIDYRSDFSKLRIFSNLQLVLGRSLICRLWLLLQKNPWKQRRLIYGNLCKKDSFSPSLISINFSPTPILYLRLKDLLTRLISFYTIASSKPPIP